MERIVNERLVWYLEPNGHISNLQCGFQNKRSTTDHLFHLEITISETFIRNKYRTAIFFDLEKAYDTTWKYGIMRDRHDLSLKAWLNTLFLLDRKFKIRIGSSISDMKNQEEGVPQGSVLSVTLFSFKINNMTKCLFPRVDGSLYAADLLTLQFKIYTHHGHKLQQCSDKI